MKRSRPAPDRSPRAHGRPVVAVVTGLAAVALAVLVLSSCAPRPDGAPPGPSRPGSTPGAATTGPAAPGGGRVLLDVSIRADEAAAPQEYVLECADGAPAPATTHPDPEAACRNVLELGAAFFTAERDPGLACTQQYGGPQTARVVGTVDGEAVDTEFSRTDGCEISRWDAAQSLLGPGGVDLPPESAGPGGA